MLIVLSSLMYTGTLFGITAFRKAPPMSTTATFLLSCAAITTMVKTALVDTVGEDRASYRSLFCMSPPCNQPCLVLVEGSIRVCLPLQEHRRSDHCCLLRCVQGICVYWLPHLERVHLRQLLDYNGFCVITPRSQCLFYADIGAGVWYPLFPPLLQECSDRVHRRCREFKSPFCHVRCYQGHILNVGPALVSVWDLDGRRVCMRPPPPAFPADPVRPVHPMSGLYLLP